ncbi:MAG: hypothetical protein KA436_01595 [Oligoflexales bacterium]|nr:hypothetical protein [Oligoflexales bacterium]
MPKHPDNSNRLLSVFSDIEMGGGGVEDDFPHSDFLERLFAVYSSSYYDDRDVSLVFNGDTFDLLKTSYEGVYPHLVNEKVALAKFDKVVRHHPAFFRGLHDFIRHRPAKRQVYFIVGNHDQELTFPAIQSRIRELCGASQQIIFPGFSLQLGNVHIEHGSQQDGMFYVNEKKLFIEYRGETYLNLPWSAVCLLNVVLPMQKDFYHLDRVKPKRLLLELLPEIKELVLGKFWRYWTTNYLRDYLSSTDPLKKVSWAMIKEVVKRTTNFSPDVDMSPFFYKRMFSSEDTRLYVVGHQHETTVRSYGNRKVIQTGCFRNEFMLEKGAKSLVAIPKTFVEIDMQDDELVASKVIEVTCDEQREYTPPPVLSFLDKIREHLGTMADRRSTVLAMERQDQKERLL